MVRDCRIKEYIFPVAAGNATTVTQASSHSLNGEVLKVIATSNFTGSVIIKDIYGTAFTNFTSTSGTGVYTPLSLTNTTGSFVVNGPISLTVGSLASGTAVTFGPVSVYYR
jgi:hypothetical protein